MSVFWNIVVGILAAIPILLNFLIDYRILRNPKFIGSHVHNLLLITTNTLTVWIILTYIQWSMMLSVDNNPFLYALISGLQTIFAQAAIICMALFVKYLVYPTFNVVQLSYSLIVASMVFGVTLFLWFAGYRGDMEGIEFGVSLINIGFMLIAVPVIYFAIQDLRIFLREPLSGNQRDQVNLFMNAAKLGILSIPMVILAIFENDLRIPLTYIILALVLYFFNRAFFIDPRISFILPEKTYLAVISSSDGKLKYQRYFIETEGDGGILITGYLSSLTSVMSNFYKTEVRPTVLQFGDKKVLFQWSANYCLTVFTDHDSSLIRTAMNRVVEMVDAKYGEEIDTYLLGTEILDLDPVFDEAFYFIYR